MKETIIRNLQHVASRVEDQDTSVSRKAIEEVIEVLQGPTVFIPSPSDLGMLVTGLACYYTDRHKKLQRAKKGQSPAAYRRNGSPASLAMELASVHELFETLKKITDGIRAAAAAGK